MHVHVPIRPSSGAEPPGHAFSRFSAQGRFLSCTQLCIVPVRQHGGPGGVIGKSTPQGESTPEESCRERWEFPFDIEQVQSKATKIPAPSSDVIPARTAALLLWLRVSQSGPPEPSSRLGTPFSRFSAKGTCLR